MSEAELRQQIVNAGKKLVEQNLVQGTFGNISVRLDDEWILITPSGMDYLTLKAEDIVKLNIRTLEYVGNKPSTERKIHAEIMLNRADVSAAIHTHSVYCSVFAVTHSQLNADGITDIAQNVKVAKYALPGTNALTKRTLKALGSNTACIMANHGMFVCGSTLEETLQRCKSVEMQAKLLIEQAE